MGSSIKEGTATKKVNTITQKRKMAKQQFWHFFNKRKTNYSLQPALECCTVSVCEFQQETVFRKKFCSFVCAVRVTELPSS